MSASAVQVVVLTVLLGHGRPGVTEAMVGALHEVLGPSVDVRVEERGTFEGEHPIAAGIVEARIAWDEPGVVALLHVRGVGDPVDRAITFSAADDPAERGRTLAYVLVATLPLPSRPQPTAPPAPPPPAPLPIAPTVERAVSPPAKGVVAVTLVGQGSLGLLDEGASTSLGGGLGVGWLAAPHALLGLRLDARTGQLASAQATTLWMSARAGASWTFLQVGRPRFLAVDVRADFGLGRETVTHFSSDDPAPVALGRWIGVADVWLEAGFWPRPAVGLVLGIGSDVVFGRTDVIVDDDRQATLGALRPMIDVGVRVEL